MTNKPEPAIDPARPWLVRCTSCGCRGRVNCGRLVQPEDGSVWPAQDTGYRHTPEGRVRYYGQ